MKSQDPQSTKTITCPFDRDEPKAEFTISTSLPISVRNKFMDVFMGAVRKAEDDEPQTASEAYIHLRELTRAGLKKVANVYDFKGKAVNINGTITDETLNLLSEIRIPGSGFENIVNWLGTEIWKANTLQDEEKKE